MNFEAIAQYSEIIGGFAFVIVAVALFRKYVLPAVRSGEVARNADLVNAERRRDALRELVAKARAEVEAADRDALAIEARAQADAMREQAAIVAEGRREGTRLIANAQGELERSRSAARDQLRIEFIEQALSRARLLATTQLTDDRNARLVARTLDELAVAESG